jgi:penicillin-binding protein 2
MDRKGGVILMDPESGEIIAMASSPDFDPTVFVSQERDAIDNLVTSMDAPMLNRSISGLYPPGSIFKVIVAAAALETGKINLSTSIFCPGEAYVGKQKFACWNTHNQQDIIEAIAHSCNVFFYKTGLLLGPQTIYDYALKFGLSKPTSVDLPYEVEGILPNPLWKKIYQFKNWYDGDTANYAIGQGDLLVTPLQMARMMAVFANSGKLVRPYIVKSVEGKDISQYQRKIVKLPFKENTIKIIRQGLKSAVAYPKGTGNVLSGLEVSVAGKTGTAQASGGLSHAWFVGFFPFQEPKYVVLTFLEHGGPGYYACVLTRQIIEKMIQEGLI